ncbi:MAG: hypothetical protein HKO98_16440 [Gemmatimonadetes bacterium]|nr:hypothetical protein [Gemmatimonadota bacterium]NNK64791.1 hypothetical protein [Gemmatimonadota bacterium]
MPDETAPRPAGGGEAPPLDAVDPVLNVFALANGMDLHRDRFDPPDRVLAWFRNGLERLIHLRPATGGTITVDLAAGPWGDRDAGRRVSLGDPVPAADLKARLPEAVEAANALTPPDPPSS